MDRVLKIYIILLVLSLTSYIVGRYTLGYFIPFFWLPIVSSIILFCLTLFNLRRKITLFFSIKLNRKGISTGGWLLFIFVILVVFNTLFVSNDFVYDFSPGKVNSLSVTSVGVLSRLEESVKVSFFYQQGDVKSLEEKRKFLNLIRKYQDLTSLLQVNFLEVTENPGIAKDYGVDQGAGVVFVEYRGHRSRIDRITEQDVTGALDIATRGVRDTIFFLEGHSEKTDQDPLSLNGISSFMRLLEGNGYHLKKMSLITKTRVPKDVQTLFIIGPKEPFLSHEVNALIHYVKRGGKLFLSLDLGGTSSLKPLLDFLGIQYENHYVIGMTQTAQGWALTPKLTLATVFNSQQIVTSEFKEGQYAVFRAPSSLILKKNKKGISSLLSTNVEVRALRNLDLKGEQKRGPFTLAMSVEPLSFSGKVVVLASSSLLTNQLWSHGVNRSFSLNVSSYLTDKPRTVKVEPAHWRVGKFSLTPDSLTLYTLLFAIPLPIVLLGLVFFRYMRRRA